MKSLIALSYYSNLSYNPIVSFEVPLTHFYTISEYTYFDVQITLIVVNIVYVLDNIKCCLCLCHLEGIRLLSILVFISSLNSLVEDVHCELLFIKDNPLLVEKCPIYLKLLVLILKR